MKRDTDNQRCFQAKLDELSEPRDHAALAMFTKLSREWRSFASELNTDAIRQATQCLVESGMAKIRLCYKVTNVETGTWISVRLIITGYFLDSAMKHVAAQCPPDWFDWERCEPKSGYFVTNENDWWLAITDEGERRLASIRTSQDPWKALELLSTVREVKATATILRESCEHGRHSQKTFEPAEGIGAGAEKSTVSNAPTVDDSSWPGQREVARRLLRNPGDIARLLKEKKLRDNGKTGRDRKVDPASVLEYCRIEDVAYNDS